jgi:hypothetical protein
MISSSHKKHKKAQKGSQERENRVVLPTSTFSSFLCLFVVFVAIVFSTRAFCGDMPSAPLDAASSRPRRIDGGRLAMGGAGGFLAQQR